MRSVEVDAKIKRKRSLTPCGRPPEVSSSRRRRSTQRVLVYPDELDELVDSSIEDITAAATNTVTVQRHCGGAGTTAGQGARDQNANVADYCARVAQSTRSQRESFNFIILHICYELNN